MNNNKARRFIYCLIISQGIAAAFLFVTAIYWQELAPIAAGLVGATTVAIIAALLLSLYRR